VLLLLLSSADAAGQTLRYTLSGIDGALEKNVRAWLGEAPETARERQNFVASARTRVDSALQALGYYDAQVELRVDRAEPMWTLQIEVAPGEPVLLRKVDLSVTGAAAGDPAFTALLRNPGFAQGDTLHHGRYETFRARLLALAQRRGSFDARIEHSRIAVNPLSGTADIALRLDSGSRFTFGDLVFDNTAVSAGMLDALRTFETGDPYDQAALGDFQARLQRTGFFAAVMVEPLREQAQAGQVPVAISLHPAKRHSFDVGIGYSTDTEGRVSLAWRTPYINRFGHSQQTRLVYSQVNPSGRFNYHIPLSHPLDDSLQLWARLEENEFGDLDSNQREFGLRRDLRHGNRLWDLSLRHLDESWSGLAPRRSGEFLLFGASLSQRRLRGSLVDPSAGWSQLYTVEYGDRRLGTEVDVLRATARWRAVTTPLPRHRVVARAEAGIAEVGSGDRDDLAPSLKFFAGGNQSLRGFGYQSIGDEVRVARDDGSEKSVVVGGTRLAILSLEYQYYFSTAWRGAVFADGGDAFDARDFDWHVGVGFGVHYLSPVGALRVEFARDVSEADPEWRLHLNIGAEF